MKQMDMDTECLRSGRGLHCLNLTVGGCRVLRYLGCLLAVCFLVCCPMGTRAADKVTFTPQWMPQAQFAGYYVALKKGFYKKAGLDVKIVHPSASNSSLERFKNGECQFSTFQLIAAMEFAEQGLPLVNILQTSQNNLQCIVSHNPLKGPLDLRGKKVGCWLSGFNQMGYALDSLYHLNIKWRPYISSTNLFNIGAIDAILAQSYNEYFQILCTGERLERKNVLYMADLGLNIPEDGLYVLRSFYDKNPDMVKRFRKASREGWIYAYRHPSEALDIVMQVVRENNVRTNPIVQRWMLDKILSAMRNKETGMVDFNLYPKAVDKTNRLLMDLKFLKRPISHKQLTRP